MGGFGTTYLTNEPENLSAKVTKPLKGITLLIEPTLGGPPLAAGCHQNRENVEAVSS